MINIDALRTNKNISGLNICLTNQDWVIRGDAAYAIGFLAEKDVLDVSSIPLLNQLLKDKNTNVRGNALYAIGNFAMNGYVDQESISLINQLLHDPDKKVRDWAIWALYKVKSKKPEELDQNWKKELENKQNEDKRFLRAKNYEHALNYLKAAELYDELEMWDDARRCRALEGRTKPLVQEVQNANSLQIPIRIPVVAEVNEETNALLDNLITLHVPQFMDSNTASEILVELNNTSNTTLTDISLDFSQLEEDFEVSGAVAVKTLSPGKALEKSIRIKPRYEKGTFPVKISITGSGVTIEKQYTIKVGGTEIY